MNRRDVLAGGLAVLSAAMPAPRTLAYPDRAIRLVVPFSPGGATDVVGRLWAEKMKPFLGTVVTEKGCIFLTEDHRCGIHRYCLEHGLDVTRYKPVDCVSYPFLPEGEQLSEFYPALCGIYFGEPRS